MFGHRHVPVGIRHVAPPIPEGSGLPQNLADSSDSTVRSGSCCKPPDARYTGSGKRAGYSPFLSPPWTDTPLRSGGAAQRHRGPGKISCRLMGCSRRTRSSSPSSAKPARTSSRESPILWRRAQPKFGGNKQWLIQKQLQLNLHPFSRRSYLGIVIARILHDFVDHGVHVLGVMMVEDQFFRAAFHDHVDRFAPVAMSPATALGCVIFGKILRVVDEDVRAFG